MSCRCSLNSPSGISPRDRQLFLYVCGNRDLGAAIPLSDLALPIHLFAPPGAATLPLALHGEIDAVARAERMEAYRREQAVLELERVEEMEARQREQAAIELAREERMEACRREQAAIREVREGLFEAIGGRNEDEFYLFAERVLGDVSDRSRARSGEGIFILENLRPDSTVEELMAEVELKMGESGLVETLAAAARTCRTCLPHQRFGALTLVEVGIRAKSHSRSLPDPFAHLSSFMQASPNGTKSFPTRVAYSSSARETASRLPPRSSSSKRAPVG